MPECRNAFDKCQCHRTYKQYNNEMDDDQKTTKVCLKLYKSKKLNWKDADKKCKTEFSYLLFNYTENTAFVDFKKEGVNLVWIGIRKLSGFYTSLSNYPSLFKESDGERGMQWADDEPIYDCVALDISSGKLVTRSCSTQLAFVCQNNGFPIYPVSNKMKAGQEEMRVAQAGLEQKMEAGQEEMRSGRENGERTRRNERID
ncbi:hypothetical protein AVEN_96416-1 [Araneus ventricosus]|uniref:C-type lectin domain-containing protein n=1 Tax=Araneus ventricosus TaxID=182803 RepID=A0A4Y2ISS9_ARAVE|nr:hypothetical protein AVEN_96416-1 [Araneus ventricosus]